MVVSLPKIADFEFFEEHSSIYTERLFIYPPETLVSTFNLLNQGKLLAIEKG